MTVSEFYEAKEVDYSGHGKKVRASFNTLRSSMRAQGASKEALEQAEEAYMAAMAAIDDIRAENSKLNKLAWHLANLG